MAKYGHTVQKFKQMAWQNTFKILLFNDANTYNRRTLGLKNEYAKYVSL